MAYGYSRTRRSSFTENYGCAVLREKGNRFPVASPPGGRPTFDVVKRMVEFIEKEYPTRITLKSVAAAVQGNPATLGRQFHQEVGVSVHSYVTTVRLKHAARLIAANVKVEAVALGVGYRSKKNFYRQFTRHFGVTPEVFRQRRRHMRR